MTSQGKHLGDYRVDWDALQRAAIRQGMSMMDLARAAKVGRSTLGGIQESRSCTPGTLSKLAEALGLEIEELLLPAKDQGSGGKDANPPGTG